MKAVVEIVAAVILLASSGYLAPKAVEKFKKETILKINTGHSQLESFSRSLIKRSKLS